VRNDTGVYEGGEISIWYDPMIAKLCTHAPNRSGAIAAMSGALDAFVISGIQHNIPFVSAIMQNQVWKSGTLSTSFIANEFPDGFKGAEITTNIQQSLAEIAVALDHIDNTRKRQISGQLNGRQVVFARNRHVKLGATWIEIEVSEAMDVAAASQVWRTGQTTFTFETTSGFMTVQVKPVLNGYQLAWRGITVEAHVHTAREADLARLMPEKKIADTSKKLLCPMPGLVVSIAVKDGQSVKAGDTLAIVEAMKMQNVLRAERDTTIKKINAKAGDSLGVDAIIMEFT
jgi:propionyl-CoA carboxylase alpha chain